MFKTPAGKFRGKPRAEQLNEYGLPTVPLVIRAGDRAVDHSREPVVADPAEWTAMARRWDDGKTATQRLQAALKAAMPGSDSCEIAVECFAPPPRGTCAGTGSAGESDCGALGGWPERTDLHCWWCLHKFDTRPFPCPVSVDSMGVYRVRGVFCGPSCAKAWIRDRTGGSTRCYPLVDALAQARGFRSEAPGRRLYCAPAAPPRELLSMFSGKDGMSIEQFRGLCAAGLDVTAPDPPFITIKQVVLAECDSLARICRSTPSRPVHRETVETLTAHASEIAARKREGFEIFAGIGARRLTEFFGGAVGLGVTADAVPAPEKTVPTSPVSSRAIKAEPAPPTLKRKRPGQGPQSDQPKKVAKRKTN